MTHQNRYCAHHTNNREKSEGDTRGRTLFFLMDQALYGLLKNRTVPIFLHIPQLDMQMICFIIQNLSHKTNRDFSLMA
jgi:hypothetical protein